MTDEKKTPAAAEEENYENVWQDLLKKASKHNSSPNASVFVFGKYLCLYTFLCSLMPVLSLSSDGDVTQVKRATGKVTC